MTKKFGANGTLTSVRKQASLPIVTDLSGNRRGRSKGQINVLECNPGDYKRKL